MAFGTQRIELPDLLEAVVKAGSFKVFAAAAIAADLSTTLKKDGPFTLFVPTDKAFGDLPRGTMEDLLRPENKETLQAIVSYHIVKGRLEATRILKLCAARTLEGNDVSFTVTGKMIMVDDASVIQTGLESRNGLIHVIDSVILPRKSRTYLRDAS